MAVWRNRRSNVGVAKSRRSDADHRADIGAESVLVRPVVLGDGRASAHARKKSARKRRWKISTKRGNASSRSRSQLIRLLGRGEGQGALGAEHAQETGLEAYATVLRRLDADLRFESGNSKYGSCEIRRIHPRAGALRQCVACPGSRARGAAEPPRGRSATARPQAPSGRSQETPEARCAGASASSRPARRCG